MSSCRPLATSYDASATTLAGPAPPWSTIQIDLDAVVRDNQPELQPLRRWARHRLAEDPNGSTIVRMERALLEEMAAFFGFTKAEFVKHVTRFMPESAPPGTRANRNGQTHDQR
jgi:hypothetical protein